MSVKQHPNLLIMSDEQALMYSDPYGHSLVQSSSRKPNSAIL